MKTDRVADLLKLDKESGLIKLFLQTKELFQSTTLALKLISIIEEQKHEEKK